MPPVDSPDDGTAATASSSARRPNVWPCSLALWSTGGSVRGASSPRSARNPLSEASASPTPRTTPDPLGTRSLPPGTTSWLGCRPASSLCPRPVDGALFWSMSFQERRRRPDVVVLTSDRVIVLEFKRGRMRPGHIDQVKAYAADLADYHSESHGLPVDPVLVYTDRPGVRIEEDSVRVVGPDRLPETLRDLDGFDGALDMRRWVGGTYAPLPSLVGAAKKIFRDEPLPAIRRAESAGIPSS